MGDSGDVGEVKLDAPAWDTWDDWGADAPAPTTLIDIPEPVREADVASPVVADADRPALAGAQEQAEKERQHKERAELERRERDRMAVSEQARSRGEPASVLVEAAEQLSADGRPELALANIVEALALDPDHLMGWFDRGVLERELGRPEAAQRAFESVLRLDASHGPAAANLAVLLDARGESETAAMWARRALLSVPTHEVLEDIIHRAEPEGDPFADLPAATPATAPAAETAPVPEPPVTPAAVPSQAPSLDATHGLPVARAIAPAEAPTAAPEPPVAAPVAPEPAVTAPAAMASAQPATPAPATPSVGATETATLDTLADEIADQIRAGDVEAAYRRVLPILTTDAAAHGRIWRLASNAMARLEFVDGAIAGFTHALALDRDAASGWYNLGVLHRRQRHIAEAATCFSTAVDLRPAYPKALAGAAETRLELGEVEPALDAWRKLLALEPAHESGVAFARLLVELGEGEGTVIASVPDLSATLPVGPELAREAITALGARTEREAVELRARAHTVRGEHVESVSAWRGLIEFDREDVTSWRGLLGALVAAGDEATAERCRLRITELEGAVVRPQVEAIELADLAAAEASAPEASAPEAVPTVDELVETLESNEELLDESTETTLSLASMSALPAPDVATPPSDPASAALAAVSPPEAPAPPVAPAAPPEFSVAAPSESSAEPEPPAEPRPQAAPESPASPTALPDLPAPATSTLTPPDTAAPPMPSNIDELLARPAEPVASPPARVPAQNEVRQVDLAAAALAATAAVARNDVGVADSGHVANSDAEWFNKGIGLLGINKFSGALGCFEKALSSLGSDPAMRIRILNSKGDTLYGLKRYADCILAYHEAYSLDMVNVSGRVLYNMGTAYAELGRYDDAINSFQNALPRGLDKVMQKRAQKQINICQKLKERRAAPHPVA